MKAIYFSRSMFSSTIVNQPFSYILAPYKATFDSETMDNNIKTRPDETAQPSILLKRLDFNGKMVHYSSIPTYYILSFHTSYPHLHHHGPTIDLNCISY
jgi:hypothetical protein